MFCKSSVYIWCATWCTKAEKKEKDKVRWKKNGQTVFLSRCINQMKQNPLITIVASSTIFDDEWWYNFWFDLRACADAHCVSIFRLAFFFFFFFFFRCYRCHSGELINQLGERAMQKQNVKTINQFMPGCRTSMFYTGCANFGNYKTVNTNYVIFFVLQLLDSFTSTITKWLIATERVKPVEREINRHSSHFAHVSSKHSVTDPQPKCHNEISV